MCVPITSTYLPSCFIGWWGLIRLSLSNWIYKCIPRFCIPQTLMNDYKCLELKHKTPRNLSRGLCRRVWYYSRVTRVRLELTANGLKGS